MNAIPQPHSDFLSQAIPRLQACPQVLGLAAGGSYLSGPMDEFSDLDLIVVVSSQIDRPELAKQLGPLLAAFPGDHVGEQRLLICLYEGPLHVDLKFLTPDELADRVEDPVVLWEREDQVTRALQAGQAAYPCPDPQWIEDRFWVWVHYAGAKIGRGELFEAVDFLAFLRQCVLGPLIQLEAGARPSGVRRLELLAPERARELQLTVSCYDREASLLALRQAIHLYRELRRPPIPRLAAEKAVVAYLDSLEPGPDGS